MPLEKRGAGEEAEDEEAGRREGEPPKAEDEKSEEKSGGVPEKRDGMAGATGVLKSKLNLKSNLIGVEVADEAEEVEVLAGADGDACSVD